MVCSFTGMRSQRGKVGGTIENGSGEMVMVDKMLNLREGNGVEGKKNIDSLSLSHTLTHTHTHTHILGTSLFCIFLVSGGGVIWTSIPSTVGFVQSSETVGFRRG
jgi:hypothetical protein